LSAALHRLAVVKEMMRSKEEDWSSFIASILDTYDVSFIPGVSGRSDGVMGMVADKLDLKSLSCCCWLSTRAAPPHVFRSPVPS
jgi:hypothetical protein